MKYFALLVFTVGCLNGASQRIVSTAPSITETLFAMGMGPRVVGVTVYCKFPPQVATLPKVGTYLSPDVEAIVALHPDLVVVQKQPNQLSEELARLHIRFIEVQSENLEAVYAGARAIGKAADATGAAETFVGHMQASLRSIEKSHVKLQAPTAVFVVGHNPGSVTGLIIGSGTSYFSDLLRIAGGSNVFNEIVEPYPKISLEDILARNPDIIFELSGESRPKQDEVIFVWQGHHSLKAVQMGRVYAIPSSAFLVPGPRAVDAATILLHLLHPELPK